MKLDPEEPTAHYNLALLYARIKEPERAQQEMQIIEKLKAKGAGNRWRRRSAPKIKSVTNPCLSVAQFVYCLWRSC